MKLKEYRIPIPLTLDEYRLGQQWTEIELLKETFRSSSSSLTIYDHPSEQERSDLIREKIPVTLKTNITSSTTMTHKQYNIKDQIPKFVELLLVKSKADLVLDEYCWDDWPYTLTIIENVDFHLRVIIQSYYRHNHLTSITHSNPNLQLFFSLNEDQMKCLKEYEIINITERLEEKEYRSDEDPTRTYSARKPHLLPLQLNMKWYENWPRTHSSMCVYKLIELVMFDERSLLNKATNKILVSLSLTLSPRSGIGSSSQWSSITKVQKILYHRFHQKMICNIDRWIDRTLSSIRDEEKCFRKQVHSQQLLDSQKEQ